jgi:hypothetical protein
LGRNTLTGPSLTVFDFSVLKRTAITERLKLQFQFQAFNIANHTNFANPIANNEVVFNMQGGQLIVPGTFGQLTSTSTSSRQLQFGLKFIW